MKPRLGKRIIVIPAGTAVAVTLLAATANRTRGPMDAETRSVDSSSWTNPVPASPAAISNLLEFSIDSFRKDDAPVGILRDDKDVDASVPWAPGMKHSVRPDDPDLPGSGTNTLRAILEPPGLPPLSVEEMSDLTWAELSRDGGVERWMQTIATASAYGGKICRLDGFRLDEIRFVGDKAFVGWRILKDPPSTDGFIRLTFWIDRRTKRIVHSGTEIHEDR